VTTAHPRWSPGAFAVAVGDVAGRWVQEGLHLDLKRAAYPRTPAGRKDAAQDMAALAIHGGSIVLGVNENADTGLGEQVTPVPVADLPEWISQVAAMRVRPPLHVQTRVLHDPGNHTLGVVIVDVPASPTAPHQVDGRYYGRADRRNTPLDDSQVEALIRQRANQLDLVSAVLAATVDAVRPRMQPSDTPRVGWVSVVAEPVPVRDPFLLRAPLADNATYPAWLRRHMEGASDAVLKQLATNTDWASEISSNWTPQRGHWSYRRTATGVEASCTGTAHTDTPLAGVLAVDETGAVRLSYNYLVYGPTGGDQQRDIVCWQDLLGIAVWTLAFATAVAADAGVAVSLATGVHVEGIGGMYPGEPNDGADPLARRRRSAERDPIPTDVYDATTLVSVAELTGDLRDAVDRLFGRLVRVMGLGDLLARQ